MNESDRARFAEKPEDEFVASWQFVKQFNDRGTYGRDVVLQVLLLIDRLCESGYDRTLRTGNSLFSLLVPRARRHGLKHAMLNESYDPKEHDPYIALSFGGLRFNPHISKPQMEVTAYLDDGVETASYPKIDLTRG